MKNILFYILLFFLISCVTTINIKENEYKENEYYEVYLPDGQKIKVTKATYYNKGILKSVVIYKEEKIMINFPDKNRGEVKYIEYYDNGNVKYALIKDNSNFIMTIHTKKNVSNVKELMYYPNGILKKVVFSDDGISLILPDGQNSTIYAISYYENTKIESIFPLPNQKTIMPNGERLLSTEVRFDERGNIVCVWLYKGEAVTMPNGEKIKVNVVFYNDNGTIKEIGSPITEMKSPNLNVN